MPKKKRRSGNRAVSNNTNNAAASAGGESSHASSATTVSQDQSQPHRSHSAARLPTTGGGGDNKVASESLLGAAATASAPAVHEHAKLEKLRGDVDFENGKLASAVVHYTKSIALCGKNPLFLVTLFVQRARAHLLLKEYEQAVEDCGVSLRLDPNEPRAYMVRGLARFQQQRLAMALGDFARCSAMVPENQLLRQRLQTAKDELSKPKHKKINLKALEWMGDISMLHSLDMQEEHDNEDEYVEEGPNWEDEDLAAMAVTESEADCKQTRQKEITPTTLLHRKQTPYFISGDALASNTHLSVPDKTNGNNHAIDSVVEYSHKASNDLMNSVVDEDMPLLVPVGEALDAHFPHLDTLTPLQAKEQALHEKTLGNKSYEEKEYVVALVHYSRAIHLYSSDPVFFSNRAIVYLKLNRFYESITDCTASIDRCPTIKAYARRASAWMALKEFALAEKDYKEALKFEPKNPDCLESLQKCLSCIEDEQLQKLQSLSNRGTSSVHCSKLATIKSELHRVRVEKQNIGMLISCATKL